VQAVYPEGDYTLAPRGEDRSEFFDLVRCTTTGTAYENLMNSEVDIIFVAGISEQHAQLAQKMGVELVFTPIGREAFVFFINAENPVDGLTTEQIRAIYSGEITNWQEVGGENIEIIAYQREENSGSQTAMIGFMDDVPLMEPFTEVVSEMTGMFVQMEYRNHANAIGYSFLYFTTEMVRSKQIKLLEIDGVAPTRENVANSSYPHADYFYAVTVAGNENPNIELFIEWILGEQGQYLIEKTGYTRVN
jgi:phosphate transport system substrate-binding protein